MTFRIGALLLGLMLLPWTAAATVAVSMPVPAEVQVALFHNIWKLDHTFDCNKAITLAIVYQEAFSDSESAKDDVVAALGRQKLRVTPILIDAKNNDALSGRLHEVDADVVYIAPLQAIDISAIARIARYRGVRTVTGVPEYVEQGLAVGIGLRRDRPLIIVNLVQARAEGSSFSSQLLELARIVGPQS
jgi:hypothetical protein